MKNLLKKKRKKFNSKKGFTLVELIVAIMILMIVISASVRGLNISYRSTLLGAAKNDAQSLAERNCEIIMSAIVTNVEKKTFDVSNIDSLDGMISVDASGNVEFLNTSQFQTDMGINLTASGTGGYNSAQYAPVKQVVGGESAVKTQRTTDGTEKKSQYYTVERTERTIGTSATTYQIYRVTTYVYYSDNGYVTCEGEISVLPKTT